MPITGGCRCGAVRYELAADVLPLTYACHCLDCQTWSGSGFALHAMLPSSLVAIDGETHRFKLASGESMASEHVGCAVCQSRVANYNPAVPGMIILRAGTLDRSAELTPAVHIWTSRKQPWLDLPQDTPRFEGTPSAKEFSQAVQAVLG